MIVEDFDDSKLLDQLLGYERRIENSLYRTMNELRKQRILGLEYRLQAGRESSAPAEPASFRVNAVLQTEMPGGVTTNGAQDEDRLCQTNPIGVDSLGV